MELLLIYVKNVWLTVENGELKVDDDFWGSKSSNRGIEVLCLKTYCFFTIVTNTKASPRVFLLNPHIVGLSIENP